jgi:diguanylate cyclase (GGDEF)-like protein
LKSIRHNLLAFALLATLLPSLGLGLVSFLRYQDVLNAEARLELRAVAKEANDELVFWRRERAHELRTLASAYTLIDGLGAAVPRPGAAAIGVDDLAVYLRAVARKLDVLRELTLLDAQGAIVASSAAAPVAVAAPARWSDNALTEGAIVAPPQWDAARGTPTLTLAVPVLSVRNEMLGTLTAVIDLGTVAPRLRGVVGALAAEVVLLATDGTPLLATQGAVAGLAPLPAPVLTELRGHTDEPFAFTGTRGREVLGVAALPGPMPIVVVAQRDRDELFAAWLDLVRLYVVLVGVLLLVVGAVAYWMGRSIVTPLGVLTRAAERIAHGDLDVTLRDTTKDEIGRLTRVFNRMAGRLRESQAALAKANQALREQKAQLETLAATDSLTGLANRARLSAFLAEEFTRFTIHHKPFALLMVDIDNLSAINADFGLATGDDVMVTFASMLRQAVRPVDHVARFGGEKFVVVLIDTPFDDAMAAAQRIHGMTDAGAFSAGPQPIVVAVSIGVAQSRDGDRDADAVLFRADHALHEAKRAGGNRVQSAM